MSHWNVCICSLLPAPGFLQTCHSSFQCKREMKYQFCFTHICVGAVSFLRMSKRMLCFSVHTAKTQTWTFLCPQRDVSAAACGDRSALNMCLHVASLHAAIKIFSGIMDVQGGYFQQILSLHILQLSSRADVFFLRSNRKVPFP